MSYYNVLLCRQINLNLNIYCHCETDHELTHNVAFVGRTRCYAVFSVCEAFSFVTNYVLVIFHRVMHNFNAAESHSNSSVFHQTVSVLR